MMQFTDLLDEYLELKRDYDEGQLSELGLARFHEIKNEINSRMRGEI